MKIPAPIIRLIDNFQRLPGIGPKTAQRLTFQLLHFPQQDLEHFANNLISLKTQTMLCKECKNVSQSEMCLICQDSMRDHNKILVVSSALDSFAIEKSGYKGLYHILHGVIDPLNNIGPEELFIKQLITRIKNKIEGTGTNNSYNTNTTSDTSFNSEFSDNSINFDTSSSSIGSSNTSITKETPLEVILATNSSMEGESTSMYITKLIKDNF